MRGALAALFLALPLAPFPQERERPDVPTVDPYTKGEPAAMERAGYVSFGPFAWGDGHDTTEVERILVVDELRWVETAHFKLGCALPEARRPLARDERAALVAELERLGERLDDVDPKTKRLDPWLRLHLFAQRLEELYADFCERLGIDETEFEAAASPTFDTVPVPGRRSGDTTPRLGPYLGQHGKFTVLLLETSASWGRYENAFLGGHTDEARRHSYRGEDSLLYGCAVQPFVTEQDDRSDVKLHCAVVEGVVQNLVDGYRSYDHDVPVWFREGLGHWYAREVDARGAASLMRAKHEPERRDEWKWEPRVRARVELGNAPDWARILAPARADPLSPVDRVFLWSRVDHLLAVGRAGLLLEAFKVPLRGATVEQRQQQAFATLWTDGAAGLERDWAAWVLETYATR